MVFVAMKCSRIYGGRYFRPHIAPGPPRTFVTAAVSQFDVSPGSRASHVVAQTITHLTPFDYTPSLHLSSFEALFVHI